MALTLETVQSLAPDQASLTAAAKLLKPALWSGLSVNAASQLFWAECQGSGSNPYRVVVDARDGGAKCSCPSRKFPCKHSLALLWQAAESPSGFADAELPDWIQEWLGRRRGASKGDAAEPGAPSPRKNIEEALAREQASTTDESPEALEKRAIAAERRAAHTASSIQSGIQELERWIADQLRNGISGLLESLPTRCRQIAARLVDAKAAALASRLDELPSRILVLPNASRAEAILHELGQLVVLCRAWLAQPDDPDARAHVQQGPGRIEVLEASGTLHRTGIWEVVGTHSESRRDGLISHSTWLLRLDDAEPQFALLLDFQPASAGRREQAFVVGYRFAAEIAYFPGRYPLRALIANNLGPVDGSGPDPIVAPRPAEPLAAHLDHLRHVPWALQTPLLLGQGRILKDAAQRYWWSNPERTQSLPLSNPDHPSLCTGVAWDQCVMVWDGSQGSLLRLSGPLGALSLGG